MIVVHGWWALAAVPGDGGTLVLWAEDGLAPAVVERRPGRRPKVRDHPFALDADQLIKALTGGDLLGRAATGSWWDPALEPGTADLALPSFSNGPAGSPELLDLRPITPDGVGETPRLHANVRWRVPTLSVRPADAMAVLATLGAGRHAGPDDVLDRPDHPPDLPDDGSRPRDDPPDAAVVRIGSELQVLQRLAGFATDLVTRGRVLPVALDTGDGGPAPGVARWRPVLTGSDAEWFRAAVAALPPATGAAFGPDQGVGDLPDPIASSAATALDALVDAVVRERVPPPPPARSRVTGVAGWRRALHGPEPFFVATGEQLAGLAHDLAGWQADVFGGTVRACFRLVEPTDDDEESVLRRPDDRLRPADEAGRWRLDLGLQLADQPSLFMPAEKIWAGEPLGLLARHTDRPQERLLAELGRALRLYPLLAVALAGPRPAELSLDTAQAHAFLAETAPLLIGAGFGVQLPGWWTRPKARLGARLRAATPAQPGRVEGRPAMGQHGLVEFDWRLSVGDEPLTDAEIDALASAQQPLVRVRGEWMQVDPDRLRRARDFLRRQNTAGSMTVGEVLAVLGGGDEGPGGLPVTGVDAQGWLGDLLAPVGEQRLRPVPVPPGFEGTLRPYQERGVAWLAFIEAAGLGGVLADDMGLGKTVQLLALIAHDRAVAGDGSGPTLLVCPMSLVGNWEREAAKFTPGLKVHVQHGKERPQGEQFRAAVAASDLVVTTYSLLARDSAALRRLPWRRVVLDEAQAVKNAATQAAIAARALRAPRRIAVTGTPVENRLADLWSLMEFANPGLLGDAASFKRRFALPIERAGDAEAGTRLRTLTQPFVLRRVKTDRSIISDLPEKLEMEVVCTLTAEQAALYREVVADMIARIGDSSGIERRGLVLATMTKLKQVCNHPAQFLRDGSRVGGRSGKLARLEETLEEVLAAGEKALLFTQYAEFGEMLRTHLTARFGREVAFLHGGVPKARRDELVARFQQVPGQPGPGAHRGGPPIFVLSLKAGGTGLTLTAANHVIHVDRWWNPAVEDQATDRAFRIGQSRAVQVRKFVCAGTLEEKISQMIRDKRGLAASIVGSGEGWLTELSTSQLRELLTLDERAVVQ